VWTPVSSKNFKTVPGWKFSGGLSVAWRQCCAVPFVLPNRPQVINKKMQKMLRRILRVKSLGKAAEQRYSSWVPLYVTRRLQLEIEAAVIAYRILSSWHSSLSGWGPRSKSRSVDRNRCIAGLLVARQPRKSSTLRHFDTSTLRHFNTSTLQHQAKLHTYSRRRSW
jgi:hypothetical protein